MNEGLLDLLVEDLRGECAALDTVVTRLPEEQWATATPAEGWDVRDQIWHLAWYEGAAYRAIAQPEVYAVENATATNDVDAFAHDVVRQGRERPPGAVLADWREQTGLFQRAALAAAPRGRVTWHDTSMSIPSMVTARIQETWAHGQDVRDSLGLAPEVSDRLRHVAHIGVNAMPYAFRAHDQTPPTAPIRVELDLPSGAQFLSGPDDASNRVTGPALAFCLVVTQRRHLDDVTLDVVGPIANDWMRIAQSYAGPAGPGRVPGQFAPVAPSTRRAD